MESSSKQQSQRIPTRGWIPGRSFVTTDPERQREIDLEHARVLAALARRETPSALRSARPAPSGWFPMQRDPGDEGGSVRRSR